MKSATVTTKRTKPRSYSAASLRAIGFKVKAQNQRFFNVFNTASGKVTSILAPKNNPPVGGVIQPNGGESRITLSKDGIEVTGIAVCDKGDKFECITGHNKALGKAVSKLYAAKVFSRARLFTPAGN